MNLNFRRAEEEPNDYARKSESVSPNADTLLPLLKEGFFFDFMPDVPGYTSSIYNELFEYLQGGQPAFFFSSNRDLNPKNGEQIWPSKENITLCFGCGSVWKILPATDSTLPFVRTCHVVTEGSTQSSTYTFCSKCAKKIDNSIIADVERTEATRAGNGAYWVRK